MSAWIQDYKGQPKDFMPRFGERGKQELNEAEQGLERLFDIGDQINVG